MQIEVWESFQKIGDTSGATCEVSCNMCDRRFLFDCVTNDVQRLMQHLQRDHYLGLKRRHSQTEEGNQDNQDEQPPSSAQRRDDNQDRPPPPPSPPGVRVGLRPEPDQSMPYVG